MYILVYLIAMYTIKYTLICVFEYVSCVLEKIWVLLPLWCNVATHAIPIIPLPVQVIHEWTS